MNVTKEHAEHLVTEFKTRIETYHGSYSFLYTAPINIFSQYVFVGLMPGGDAEDPPNLFLKKGNAYVDEKWDKTTGGYNLLQKEVIKFFKGLSHHVGIEKWDDWMSHSWLISNYVFYRSADWDSMKKNKGQMEVCKGIWRDIFAISVPKVLVCYGKDCYFNMKELIHEKGFTVDDEKLSDGSWKGPNVAILKRGEQQCLLVGFYCLSRYRIIERPENKATMDLVYRQIKAHL